MTSPSRTTSTTLRSRARWPSDADGDDPAPDGWDAVRINLIWAQSVEGVIGLNGGLPWRLPEDLAHFRNATHGGVVIMGRRTWESLPAGSRPLRDRRNIVLTKDRAWRARGAEIASSVDEALALASGAPDAWIVGGGAVYEQFLHVAHRAVVTTVRLAIPGDTYAPALGADWKVASSTGWLTSRAGLEYQIARWDRSAEVAC